VDIWDSYSTEAKTPHSPRTYQFQRT